MVTQIIKNFDSLATTPLRKDALFILESGLQAIDTKAALRKTVSRQQKILTVGRKRFQLDSFRRIFVIGIGKASFKAAQELEKILSHRITGGIVLDVQSGPLKRIKSIAGTHPFPILC